LMRVGREGVRQQVGAPVDKLGRFRSQIIDDAKEFFTDRIAKTIDDYKSIDSKWRL
jgi:hypothetical protein